LQNKYGKISVNLDSGEFTVVEWFLREPAIFITE
jgi:hypothetical protein